ncbi:MAG: amylo-alpha-1,6-glucosidase [Bifidobacterium sp.]|uniref:Amylo-alpha-1,6-glucosidase n=1 Tax=Bifidobacterium fermentum TaxID=3059035 RepID=A0AB39UE43_9BIFI
MNDAMNMNDAVNTNSEHTDTDNAMDSQTPWTSWGKTVEHDFHIDEGELHLAFNPFGDIRSIRVGDIQISQYQPSVHDSAISGMWLRRRHGSDLAVIPLTGTHAGQSGESAAQFVCSEHCARWSGQGLGVRWEVTLRPIMNVPQGIADLSGKGCSWVWNARIKPIDGSSVDPDDDWDLVSAQDVALAPVEQALTSEPYISQYVAFHEERNDTSGSVVSARQTMSCAPQLPLLVSTIAEGTAAYLTDGFDFYGNQARLGSEPQALRDADWSGGHINQYEFAMIALLSQAKRIDKAGAEWNQIFVFNPDYRGEMADASNAFAEVDTLEDVLRSCVSEPEPDTEEIARSAGTASPTHASHVAHSSHETHPDAGHPASLLATARGINADVLSDEQLRSLVGGSIISPEYGDHSRLLSYFAEDATHVVSGAKELAVARSHGQVLLSGGEFDPELPVLAATTYAPGVFASHIVLGNTNMNRLVSVQRNALNLLRSQGIRILVRLDGEWRVLQVPSAFIMHLGGSRWVYRIGELVLDVMTTANVGDNGLDIRFTASQPVEAMLTVDIEEPTQWYARSTEHGVIFAPAWDSAAFKQYPGLSYAFEAEHAQCGSDDALFADAHADVRKASSGLPQHGGVFTFTMIDRRELHLAVTASVSGAQEAQDLADRMIQQPIDIARVLQEHNRRIAGFDDELHVDGTGRLSEFNILIPWFVQNALVHFLSPHGLEQYSGAAWGTRDVLQGPLEMELAFGHFSGAREILLKVFAHQNSDGSLPQWFMFDAYSSMYQKDAHGDIPVWPLMAMGEYLSASGDYDILSQEQPFLDDAGKATVIQHLERILSYIENHRVPGTKLFSYGNGDWDDTLQPAQESMKKNMASSWTIALLHQASLMLASQLKSAGLAELAARFVAEAETIEAAFPKDFILDDVIAGYVNFTEQGPQPIIHPTDKRTGLQYRLIPMTRSIISGLLTPAQVEGHLRLIQDNLHYPDGVRLMNKPARFADGVPLYFKRAEQAANVGREIGLMYTHAHIRYSEALATLGKDSLVDELLRISPVGQFSRLGTSEIRQRNCYFASSDADFPDRYEAARDWDRLRGDTERPVGVRGGWRVYSSGPGIYLRQLVQHVFGLQIEAARIVIDPVLAVEDDGTSIGVRLFGAERSIRYHVRNDDTPVIVLADGKALSGNYQQLPYRQGGLVLDAAQLGDAKEIDVTVGAKRSTIGR